MIKKILIILGIAVGAVVLLIVLDYLMLLVFKTGPFIAIKEEDSKGYVTYKATFYNVYMCNKNDKKDKVITYFSKDYDCDIHNMPEEQTYIIIDYTEECDSALEEVGRDDMFIYYFPCIKSDKVLVKYKDGTILSLREALDQEKISMQELYDKHKSMFFVAAINNEEEETLEE